MKLAPNGVATKIAITIKRTPNTNNNLLINRESLAIKLRQTNITPKTKKVIISQKPIVLTSNYLKFHST